MNRFAPLLLLAILALTPACATRNATPDYAPGGYVIHSETLDPELTETWPGIEQDTQLSEPEKQALQSVQDVHCNLDDYARERIRDQFIHLHHSMPDTVDRWLERSEHYLPYARSIFRDRGLPEELAYLPFIESGFNPRAYSHAGAAGMWQFMPFTGRKYGLRVDNWMDERRDPYRATIAAADYLEFLYSLFGDWTLALAAYNCGEGKMLRAVEVTGGRNFFEVAERNHMLSGSARLRQETMDYVPRFMAMMKIAENLELLGYEPVNMEGGSGVVPVRVQPGTNLRGLARACGMSYESFSEENLAFKQDSSPLDQTCNVYLPARMVADAEDFLAAPESTAPSSSTHVVQTGEFLSLIAARYNTTVAEIVQANGLTSNVIHPGQRLKITGSDTMTAAAAPRQSAPVETASSASPNADTTDQIRRETPNRAESPEPRPVPVHTASHEGFSGSYQVSPGDTLFSLSRRYGVSVDALLSANNLSSPQDLMAGQHLRVPGGPVQVADASPAPSSSAASSSDPEVYRVQDGDTVYSISRKFSVSPHDVLRWNSLSESAVIHPGDSLTLYRP